MKSVELARTDPGVHSSSRARIAALGLGAAFLLCFAPVLAALLRQWWRHEEYSYGFLIPPLSFYMVWQRREALRRIASRPSHLLGAVALAAALAVQLVGVAGGVMLLQELALVLAIGALVLLLLGVRVLGQVWLPVAYLLFMIPFWDLVAARFQLPLQEISADLATWILRGLAIPVHREGLILHLPHQSVIVADVCSGARFLISVVAIGVPMAYLFLRGAWRRICLIVFALAVAILGNGLRVAVVAHLFNIGVLKPESGVVHALQGVLVSWIGYAALVLGTFALGRRQPPLPAIAGVGDAAPAAGSGRGVPLAGLVLAAAVLLAGAGVRQLEPRPVALAGDLERLPLAVGSWRGAPVRFASVYADLGIDRELSREYRSADGATLQFYVGYFERQEQDQELVGEATARLHDAALSERIDLEGGGAFTVNTVLEREGERRRLTYFWYDLHGRQVANRYLAKAYTVADALLRRRSDGAVIVVSVDVDAGEAPALAAAAGKDFIRQSVPLLAPLLPR